jgi:hypothetical protein
MRVDGKLNSRLKDRICQMTCSGIVADAIGTGIKLSSGTGCACCDDYEQVKVWSSVDQQAMLSQNPGLNGGLR